MGLPEVGQGLSWNSQEEREIDMSHKWVSQVIPEETGMKNYIRDHVLNCLPCQPLILPDRENKGLTGSPCPLSPLVHPPAFGACFLFDFFKNFPISCCCVCVFGALVCVVVNVWLNVWVFCVLCIFVCVCVFVYARVSECM